MKEKLTININELILKQRKFTTSELSRGTGIHSTKKGKGSYNRRSKYKQNYREYWRERISLL